VHENPSSGEFYSTTTLGCNLDAIQHFLQSKWIECDSMLKIMTWIRSPPDEVKFFESMALRVTDKQGLMMIAV
jgi:hypothetical protein